MINIKHGPRDWYLTKYNTEKAVEALEERVKVSRKYDVPDIAGYDKNGHDFYIDKDVPKTCPFPGGEIEVDCGLLVHEGIEIALLKLFPSLTYQDTHQIALLGEKEYIETRYGMGAWDHYCAFMRVQGEKCWKKKNPQAPPGLYKKPYVDEKQFSKLKEMGYVREASGV